MEAINELATALAKAQGAMKGAIKDSQNPFFKSTYANLESVWDACRDALSKNGLAVIQTTDYKEEPGSGGHPVLITTLVHSSGQSISGTYPLRPVKDDPQGLGSAITYARRYALAAIVGVNQTDDDGEAASGRPQQPQKQPEIGSVQQKVSSTKQVNDASKGPCAHKQWLPSHFNPNEEWCPDCKAKRPIIKGI